MMVSGFAPVWSMSVQGSVTSPAPGWPGVAWSASPGSGTPAPDGPTAIKGGR